MARPIVAVDVDDVLAIYAQTFIAFSNDRWGTALTVDDYDEDWAMVWHMDVNNQDHWKEINRRSDEFTAQAIRTMPHNQAAFQVLKRLKDTYDLIVVTSRRRQIRDETLAWLQEHFPGIFAEDHVFFSGIWDTIEGASLAKTKADILIELHAEYLIDDQPKHCNAATERGVTSLLFGTYGVHERNPIHDDVVRVKDWRAVQEFFDAKARS